MNMYQENMFLGISKYTNNIHSFIYLLMKSQITFSPRTKVKHLSRLCSHIEAPQVLYTFTVLKI